MIREDTVPLMNTYMFRAEETLFIHQISSRVHILVLDHVKSLCFRCGHSSVFRPIMIREEYCEMSLTCRNCETRQITYLFTLKGTK